MENQKPTKIPKEVEQLNYEFFILRRMIQQLPGKTGELILTQYDKVVAAISERDRVFRDKISCLVDDAILEIKFQEFDLEATRRERDQLKDQL